MARSQQQLLTRHLLAVEGLQLVLLGMAAQQLVQRKELLPFLRMSLQWPHTRCRSCQRRCRGWLALA